MHMSAADIVTLREHQTHIRKQQKTNTNICTNDMKQEQHWKLPLKLTLKN